jgi:hypothetical protein
MYVFANAKARHQELVHIVDRVVEIGLRGGAWAELQDDTPLQSPRIQSNVPLPSNTKPRPGLPSTLPSSNDT